MKLGWLVVLELGVGIQFWETMKKADEMVLLTSTEGVVRWWKDYFCAVPSSGQA